MESPAAACAPVTEILGLRDVSPMGGSPTMLRTRHGRASCQAPLQGTGLHREPPPCRAILRAPRVVICAIAGLGPREVEKSGDAVLPVLSQEDLNELSAAQAGMPGWIAEPLSARRVPRTAHTTHVLAVLVGWCRRRSTSRPIASYQPIGPCQIFR